MKHQRVIKLILFIVLLLNYKFMYSQIDIPKEIYQEIDSVFVYGDGIGEEYILNFLNKYPTSAYLKGMFVYYLFFNVDEERANKTLEVYLKENILLNNNSYINLAKGILSNYFGNQDAAVEYFDRSISLDKENKNKWVRYELAMVYYDDISVRKKYLQEALLIDYNFVTAIVELSTLYKEQRQYDKALKTLEKAECIDKSNLIYYNIGLLFLEQDSYKKAEKYFVLSNQVKDNSDSYVGLGYINQYFRNSSNKALEFYNKALEVDSLNSIVYKRIGLLYLEKGDLKQAEKFLLKSLELAPNMVDNHSEYIYVLVLIKDYKRANTALKEAFQLFGYGIKELHFWNILLLSINGDKEKGQNEIDDYIQKFSSGDVFWLKQELKAWGVTISPLGVE